MQQWKELITEPLNKHDGGIGPQRSESDFKTTAGSGLDTRMLKPQHVIALTASDDRLSRHDTRKSDAKCVSNVSP